MADLHKAEAAAREALADTEAPFRYARHRKALIDLLAALDAARGGAVGYVFPGDVDRAKLDDVWFPIQPTKRDDYREPVFYAPPAALAVPEDAIEAAYWDFDARHKGYGPHKTTPQSERDAFKWAVRAMLAAANKENTNG